MTLAEFLRARLDEDERHAHAALGILGHENEWWRWQRLHEVPAITRADARHIERWSPRRVLVEVDAKRRIVDGIVDADPHSAYITGTFTAWDVLHLLALPYADHPSYDHAWRPQ